MTPALPRRERFRGIDLKSWCRRFNPVPAHQFFLEVRRPCSSLRIAIDLGSSFYLFSLGVPRRISESKMKFWPEGSIMTWILSLSF